jgi:hypothetical protein
MRQGSERDGDAGMLGYWNAGMLEYWNTGMKGLGDERMRER